MTLKLNRLTPKFIASIDRPGRYADGGRLYLEVGPGGKAKSFVFIYDRKRFGIKTPGSIGVGSARTTPLGDARGDRDRYNDQLRKRIDPLAQLNADRGTAAKGMTFEALADDFVNHQSTQIKKPWKWRTKDQAEGIIKNHLVPLHHMRPADITPRHIFDVIHPLTKTKPTTAAWALNRIRTILDWAIVNEILEHNAASMEGSLAKMFGTDRLEPEHTPRAALDYQKVPTLMAKLALFNKPRDYYIMSEAIRSSKKCASAIEDAINDGRLKTLPPEYPMLTRMWNARRIRPADLFDVWPDAQKIIPGLPLVGSFLLEFLILNGSRFDEVCNMVWDEWQREENLWVIPWERMKGRNRTGQKEIHIDHIIPLAQRSVKILTLLDEQRKREQNPSQFVFGHHTRAYFGTKTNMLFGKPPSNANILDILRRLMAREDASATLHGMRAAFRSWAGKQRVHGYPRFAESDAERAIAHVKGEGTTALVRLYNRQRKYSRKDPDIAALVPIFEGWANFLTGGGGDVLRFQRKQAAGG